MDQINFIQFLQGPQAERAARLLTLLLLLWVAYSAARLSWRLLPAPAPMEADISLPVVASSSASAPDSSVQQLAQWHLFGSLEQAPRPVVSAPIDAPDTRLNLTLMGVVSSDSSRARAIIADERGKEAAYSVGQQLPGGAELREIYPDRVILLRNQRHETLRLPSEIEGPSGGARRAVSMPNRGPQSSAAVGARLSQYRDALNNDPASLLTLVRPVPVREEGRFVGFRLQPGRDRQALSDLGLQAGDVVTSINGTTIDNPVKGMQIMRTLKTADQLNLTVRRNGTDMHLAFQLP